MPSTYAHRRFGANVLDHLPAPLREKLEAHRELYDIGLHGPDLLFYYHAEKSTTVAALGNAMHDEPGRTFFDRARRVVHEEADREAALAYALGFVCHFAQNGTQSPARRPAQPRGRLPRAPPAVPGQRTFCPARRAWRCPAQRPWWTFPHGNRTAGPARAGRYRTAPGAPPAFPAAARADGPAHLRQSGGVRR